MAIDPKDVQGMIEQAGGTVRDVTLYPGGHASCVASFPLPDDHWIYQADAEGFQTPPPMPFRMGVNDWRRRAITPLVVEAVRYGVRAATMCGKDTDFDPDALVRNVLVGLFGYHTPTGLSGDAWANPDPPPPYCQWYKVDGEAVRVGDRMRFSVALLRGMLEDSSNADVFATEVVEVAEIRQRDDGTKDMSLKRVEQEEHRDLARQADCDNPGDLRVRGGIDGGRGCGSGGALETARGVEAPPVPPAQEEPAS